MKKDSSRQFKVVIERDEDGYFVASVPALPGCHTQAKTFPDMLKRIKEAIQLCLEVAASDPEYRRKVERLSYNPSFVGLEVISV